MKVMTRFNRISFSVLLILVGGLVIYKFAQWYYCLPPLTSYFLPGACLTEDEATFKNVGSAEFRAVDIDCDTLAKEEFVRVYAYRNDASSLLPKWLRRRTEVFNYDPGTPNNLPRIESMGNRTIRISVPDVSEILYKQASWDGNVLEYDVGKADYPSANVAVGK